MKNFDFWIVDAFVGEIEGRKLRGNPAAVVLLDEFASDAVMLERANEFNLAETAFVVPRGGVNFDLRWFTPQVEVDLCGHATLAATAALLDAKKIVVGQTACFQTRSGVLKALVKEESIELDFPVQHVHEQGMPEELALAFGWDQTQRGFEGQRSCFRASDDWLIVVHQVELENPRVNFEALAQIDARGVILTSQPEWPSSDADFLSRFFAPRVGVNEDPVTGSAHTELTPFWAHRLGKTQMKALQLSQRGGALEVELRGERVGIAGRSEIRAQGQLR